MFSYRFYCNRCGALFECDTKEQYRTVRKMHKRAGCILVDAQLKNPIYVRPELKDDIKELLARKKD